ncbi:MAG: hypothetical protein V4663_06685 [Bacteroidota bacterium]
MRKYIFLAITLVISATTFAQKPTTSTPKAKFFVDEKETDILVAKLIDPANQASISIGGVLPSDMTKKTLNNKPTSLHITTNPDAKFMSLNEFFEVYKVPEANRNIIKVNGELLRMKDNFLANKSRIAKVEQNKDATGTAFINIITTVGKK